MLNEGYRVSVVTGAREGGIGFESARLLAGEEGVVYLTTHREKDAIASARILQEEGHNVEPAKLDVTSQRDVDLVMDRIKAKHGNVHTLVSCAVLFPEKDRSQGITRVSLSTVRKIFAVNTLGALRMIQAVLPGMEEEGFGRIVQVVGSWGSYTRALNELGGKGGGYGLSKAGETYLVPSVAADLLRRGHPNIYAFAVDPGSVRTNMNPGGERSAADAALDIFHLATLPEQSGVTGTLFRHGEQVLFGSYSPKALSIKS